MVQAINTQPASSPLYSSASVKFTIYRNETRTLHLYEGYTRLRILKGRAQVGYACRTFTLERGKEYVFRGKAFIAVISPAGCAELVYELLC